MFNVVKLGRCEVEKCFCDHPVLLLYLELEFSVNFELNFLNYLRHPVK